jgi:hypothetical protein
MSATVIWSDLPFGSGRSDLEQAMSVYLVHGVEKFDVAFCSIGGFRFHHFTPIYEPYSVIPLI